MSLTGSQRGNKTNLNKINKMGETAVEWLKNELNKIELKYLNKVIDRKVYIKLKSEAFDQAKEMEKQQITDAFNEGNWVGRCAIVDDNLSNKKVEKSAQTYYNENFKSE